MKQFQFHKGTIRTQFSNIYILYQPYFNSIKVQLEPAALVVVGVTSIFQFHKGTIRTCLGWNASPLDVSFQFHKGTIRTLGFSFA